MTSETYVIDEMISAKAIAARVEALMGAVVGRFGGLDILLNVAGDSSKFALRDLPEAEWDRILTLNLKSVFLCCKAAIPHLIARGGGRIINMASSRGLQGQPNGAHYAASIIMILGTPVVAITIVLLALERGLHLGIFDPALGGDPVLFQHLFWFYSHPAVYIMILPAMGVISELVACFARKRVFGYSFVAVSSLLIAGIGFAMLYSAANGEFHPWASRQMIRFAIVFDGSLSVPNSFQGRIKGVDRLVIKAQPD